MLRNALAAALVALVAACTAPRVPLAGAAPAAAAARTEVVWLGQAAFKITTPSGKVIVTDPWLRSSMSSAASTCCC